MADKSWDDKLEPARRKSGSYGSIWRHVFTFDKELNKHAASCEIILWKFSSFARCCRAYLPTKEFALSLILWRYNEGLQDDCMLMYCALFFCNGNIYLVVIKKNGNGGNEDQSNALGVRDCCIGGPHSYFALGDPDFCSIISC